MKIYKVLKIGTKLGLHCGVGVDDEGRSGGLALLWHSDMDVDIKSYSIGQVDALIRGGTESTPWHFKGFYGNPVKEKKRESWQLLRRLSTNRTLPWACMGDFNEVLFQFEKKGKRDRCSK